MRLDNPYLCDYCNNRKRDVNAWWLRVPSATFVLAPWHDQDAQLDGVEHVCSQSCAVKALAKWMAESPNVTSNAGASPGSAAALSPSQSLPLMRLPEGVGFE